MKILTLLKVLLKILTLLKNLFGKNTPAEPAVESFEAFSEALQVLVDATLDKTTIHVEIEPYIVPNGIAVFARGGTIGTSSYMLGYRAMRFGNDAIISFTEKVYEYVGSNLSPSGAQVKKEYRNRLLTHAKAQLDALRSAFPDAIVDIVGREGRVVHDTARPQLHLIGMRSA